MKGGNGSGFVAAGQFAEHFVEAAWILVEFDEAEAAGSGEAVDFSREGAGGSIGPWGDEGFEVFA